MPRPSICGVQVNTHHVIYTCGALVLDLPSPDFENKESFNNNRVNRQSRGGDQFIATRDYWPKSKTYEMTWSWLTYAKRQEVQRFIHNTLGQGMTLTDHEGRNYNGVINNPDAAFTESGHEKNSVSIHFETDN